MSASPSAQQSDDAEDEALRKARQLLQKLEEIRTVRMATGIVMASCDLSEADAVEVLVDRARREGVLLSTVAHAVVDTGEI